MAAMGGRPATDYVGMRRASPGNRGADSGRPRSDLGLWLPSESLNLANIDVNGVYFGSVENGGMFYRDVPPGTYHIVPESWAHNPSTTPTQDANVAVAPGQQVYIKIVDLTSWAVSVSASRTFRRDAFWAYLIPRRSRRPKSLATAAASERLAAMFAAR